MPQALPSDSDTSMRGNLLVARIAFVFAVLVILVLRMNDAISSYFGAGALILLASSSLLVAYRRTQDLFHPWAFGNFYLHYVLLVPVIYMHSSGDSIGRIPVTALSGVAPDVMIYCAAGWMIGTTISSSPRSDRPNVQELWKLDKLSALGTWILAVSLIATMALYVASSGESYGANQGLYTGLSALATLSEGLLAVGVLLACAASERRCLLSPLQWVILACAVGIALFGLSSRSAVLTPALLLAWYGTRRRRIGNREDNCRNRGGRQRVQLDRKRARWGRRSGAQCL